MTHTQAILDFASSPHSLPDAARADTLRLLADTLAVGAAGAREASLVETVFGNEASVGNCRVLNSDRHHSPGSAAFINGYSIHCLEWDAVHEPAVVHALSVVTASLLAMPKGEQNDISERFLTSLAVGVDIASGLGIAATGPMKFFRPATAGIIGAAIACARYVGIAPAYYPDVMGLAYSFAGGTMQAHVEASKALPLQIGNAARCAVNALDMAAHGIQGPHDVLEGPFGYSNLIEPLDLPRYTENLGEVWRISEVSIKPFPSGRASHGALGVLFDIAASEKITLADVEAITLSAPPLIQRLVGRPFKENMTPAYARLCLPLLAPMMLRDGHIDPSLFTPEGLAAPELAKLGTKVQIVVDDNPDGNAMAPQHLTIKRKDGRVIERQINANLGSPDAPMSAVQIKQKFDLCRRLAGKDCDTRIFNNPLDYVSKPK